MLNDEKRISRDPRLREDDILNIERGGMTVLLLSARCAGTPTGLKPLSMTGKEAVLAH